jgi:AmiR/NasT family two-component response regulator
VGEVRLGALNVYAADAALVAEPLVHTAEMLGAATGAILHETGAKAELATLAGDLQKAMESRATIEQAKGILMAMHGCTADEAFHRLADLSSRTNVKVRVLAERIVADAAPASGEMAAAVPRARED